jgi:hypothetical protein
MRYIRLPLPVGLLLGLAACSAAAPPDSDVIGLPGKGKDLAAFQQDDTACRNYALARLSPTAGPAGGAPLAAQPFGVSYAQCMVAHGDTVQPAPEPAYAAYPYAYPYGFAEPYFDGFEVGGFYGGDRDFGGRDRAWHGGDWHGGEGHGGGFFHGGGRR